MPVASALAPLAHGSASGLRTVTSTTVLRSTFATPTQLGNIVCGCSMVRWWWLTRLASFPEERSVAHVERGNSTHRRREEYRLQWEVNKSVLTRRVCRSAGAKACAVASGDSTCEQAGAVAVGEAHTGPATCAEWAVGVGESDGASAVWRHQLDVQPDPLVSSWACNAAHCCVLAR